MEDAFQGAVRGGLRLKRTSGVVNVSAKKQKKAKSRKGRQEQDALEREEVAVVDEKGIPCEAPANAAARPAPPTARSEEAEEKGDEAGARASSEGSASKSPEERRGSPAAGEGELEALLRETDPSWTKAERAFFVSRMTREKERIERQLQLSHRQRMEKFNQHLASLSEHFDQPRVGPG